MAMKPDGSIDTSALVGKDVELMVDMREQRSITTGNNINVNADLFQMTLPPVFLIPSFLSLAQREENLYRSVAVLKVINRFGILDSVIQIDKGSRISTRDLMYDGETGDAILTRTQNEFNDSIYNFNYPAHWAYDGMGGAYKNIDVTLSGIFMKNGKITSGLPTDTNESMFFASGDELLVSSKRSIAAGVGCLDIYSTFPAFSKIYAVNSSVIGSSTPSLYFVDKDGQAFGGNDITLKVIRSGRRNMAASAGSVTTLKNPLIYNSTQKKYELTLNTASQVLNASVAHYNQLWKVGDKKQQAETITDPCNLCCLKPLIQNMFRDVTLPRPFNVLSTQSVGLTLRTILDRTNSYYEYEPVDSACGFFKGHLDELFYWIPLEKDGPGYVGPADSGEVFYKFKLGSAVIKIIADGYLEWDTFDRILSKHECSGPALELCKTSNTDSCYTYRIPVDTNRSSCYVYNNYNCDQSNSNINVPLDNPSFILSSRYLITSFRLVYDGTDNVYVTPELIGVAPPDYSQLATLAHLEVEAGCEPLISSYCYSSITDTVINPYQYGLIGNFRVDSVYAYYGQRIKSSFPSSTDIRRDGSFSDFVPFWKFTNGKLEMQRDTTRWVWTSTSTLFNERGLELENKDPLNRYNAGIYGYNNTLPIAMVQNSQYREAAFEGFEDYSFGSDNCSSACVSKRHFDLDNLTNNITTEQKHSGKYSIKVLADSTVGIAAALGGDLMQIPTFSFNMASNSCAGSYLQNIRTDGSALLPSFKPLAGKKIIFSAWVKEERECNGTSYSGNRIIVGVSTASNTVTTIHYPQGSIIEGWQRYEIVVDLPPDGISVSFNLQSTGGSSLYFDDIRIHPFNANMKSFVYDPVNLRLMAELDENNYASFYEYDDDGTLIRVKKETQRGIKTVRETRSALIKP
jgi:hypothetical protein